MSPSRQPNPYFSSVAFFVSPVNLICGSTTFAGSTLGATAGGSPAPAGVGAAIRSSAFWKKTLNRSIGSGKIVVELFSAAISVTVYK